MYRNDLIRSAIATKFGSRSEFVRQTGMDRAVVDRLWDGEEVTIPSLTTASEKLDIPMSELFSEIEGIPARS